jgi:hypothetical protein
LEAVTSQSPFAAQQISLNLNLDVYQLRHLQQFFPYPDRSAFSPRYISSTYSKHSSRRCNICPQHAQQGEYPFSTAPAPFTCKFKTDTGQVVSQSEWLEARKALLEKEKELTRASDALAAERRELPMVKVEKEYTFKGPDDKELSLADLFGDKDQLIVYHFMFGPDDDCGCSGCSFIGM